MKHTNILILFFLAIIGISCEYDVEDIEIPNFEKKLVVHCFLSPNDTIIKVKVSYNKPVFGLQTYENPDISGVQVFISDDIKEAQLNLINGVFQMDPINFPIVEGKTYNLKVTDKLGNVATSQCKIPLFRDLNPKIDASSTKMLTNDWGIITETKRVDIKFSFYDYKGEENYYQLLGYFNEYYWSGYDSTFHNNVVVSFRPNEALKFYNLTDVNNDGEKLNYNFSNEFFYPIDNNGTRMIRTDSMFCKVQVLQINKEYYTYSKSLENYEDDDSYFSEISPIYSNINGGLGIFCGYSQKVYTLKINKDMVEYK